MLERTEQIDVALTEEEKATGLYKRYLQQEKETVLKRIEREKILDTNVDEIVQEIRIRAVIRGVAALVGEEIGKGF